MSDLLTAALEFATKKWRVFPVKARGKTPLTSNGLKDATTDQEIIRDWWKKWPSANIGVPTGDAIVVDIDGEKGEDSLRVLEAEFGPLPPTLQSSTGKGRHFWFASNGTGVRNSAGKLGEGIDIRGVGGFVVAPPSIHESGKRYEWVSSDAPLAELPPWIAAKLKAPARRANSCTNGQGEKIPAGKRNASLASLAGTMRRRGMSPAAILAALLEHNRESCDPPLPDREVQVIAESIGRYPASTVESVDAPDSCAAQSDDETPFQGDQANAERLASANAGKLIYLADRQVRCAWDGRVWRLGDDGSWGRAAIETVRELYLAAAHELNPASRVMLWERAQPVNKRDTTEVEPRMEDNSDENIGQATRGSLTTDSKQET